MPTYTVKPVEAWSTISFTLFASAAAVVSWLCSALQVRDNIYNIVKEFLSNKVNINYTIYQST